jgi:hypothetical protein
VVPASELVAVRAQIAQLQRMLGKKTMGLGILKEAVEFSREKRDCALTLVGHGWPVKVVCSPLGVAHSSVWRPNDSDDRDGQTFHQSADVILVDAIGAEITALPIYSYLGANPLINRTRALMSAFALLIGIQTINHKFYRVMEETCLLLPETPKHHVSTVCATTTSGWLNQISAAFR